MEDSSPRSAAYWNERITVDGMRHFWIGRGESTVSEV